MAAGSAADSGSDVRDRAGGIRGKSFDSGEEARYFLQGALRGGEADALQAASAEVLQALQRERQMRAALGGDEGVDLIDDDGLHRAQGLARVGGE